MSSSQPSAGAPSTAGTILWWLRRPGSERQLTDCLGELSRVDPAIAHGLADALLDAASEDGDKRVEALRRALPTRLTCSREDPTGELVVRERSWWRPEKARRGRLDWVFHPPGQERSARSFQLAVEVKIGAGLQRNQLADYHRHLSRDQDGQRGLLVLGRNVPQRGLLDETSEFWLGAVLWEQVLPRLRDVRPHDEALAAQWPLLLDILETRDDLGTEPPSWDTVAAPGSRGAVRRLLENGHPGAEAAFRGALAKRPSGHAEAQRLGALRIRSTTRAVVLDIRVPAVQERAVAQLRLRGTSAGVELVSKVHPLPRPKLIKQAKRRHDAALHRLATDRLVPQYSPTGRSYAREILLPLHNGDIQQVVSEAVKRELQHIARSGVLDEDIRDAK